MSLESLIQKVTAVKSQETKTQLNATQHHLSMIGKSYTKAFSEKKQVEVNTEREVKPIDLSFDD